MLFLPTLRPHNAPEHRRISVAQGTDSFCYEILYRVGGQQPQLRPLESSNEVKGSLATSPTPILAVDDSEAWRRFASSTLQKQPGYQVAGEASDGLEAIRKAQQLQPDLIILDIGLPTLNGIETARQIRRVTSASRILFMSENRSLDI